MALLKINVVNATNGALYINPNLIISINVQTRADKFLVHLTLASGKHYYLKDDLGNYEYNTLEEAELLVDAIGAYITGFGSNEPPLDLGYLGETLCWEGECKTPTLVNLGDSLCYTGDCDIPTVTEIEESLDWN